ncbi:MAG: adenine glycosylase [Eggerthellaceae bacterium]|nr:adenine glycosylase [Eggerthellaceae bacterium]
MANPLNLDVVPPEMGGFVSLVWEMGRVHARAGLPWRNIDDPYAVYVSEVMLQQTQVVRVLDYWPSWMQAFPTIDSLAAASTSDVLERWQGLGYNRRALALKRSAEQCASLYAGNLPRSLSELESLPGVGPATAAGIVAFAYQEPCVYLETNVRSVYLHHFFSSEVSRVSDRDLVPLVQATCSRDDPRGWYYALLDYGAYLKRVLPNPSRKSSSYHRQSPFEGSVRQKRAFLVREVLAEPGIEVADLRNALDEHERSKGRDIVSDEMFQRLMSSLKDEGFFEIVDDKVVP